MMLQLRARRRCALGVVGLLTGVVGYRGTVPMLPLSATTHPSCTTLSPPSVAAWIGRWYIATADGRLQGETVVSPTPVGCGVWEQWHGTSGGNGRSLSLQDAATKRWSHMFVNDTGLVLTAEGVEREGRLVWTLGHFSEPRDTNEHEQWEWAYDSLPRHSGSISHDGGKTWQRIFAFSYRPWSDSLPPVSRHSGPCHAVVGYRSLDYYIGTWDVVAADGRKVAESRVDTLLDGCALREDLRSPDNSSLRLFGFDVLAKVWRVLGAATDRGVTRIEGTAISASSTSFTDASTSPTLTRTRWTLDQLSADRLRWREERSSDGARTWAVMDERTYRRRGH